MSTYVTGLPGSRAITLGGLVVIDFSCGRIEISSGSMTVETCPGML